MLRRFAILTFGCRVNQADSAEIDAALRRAGADPAPLASADVIVVNGCAVTTAAEQDTRRALRRLNREHPAARLVATGCVATSCHHALSCLPGVVAVVGHDGPAADVATWLDSGHLGAATTCEPRDDRSGGRPRRARLAPGDGGRTVGTLAVQHGCDESCAFCIVPRTRGPGRSRPIGEVMTVVGEALAAGFREVSISGVNLGAWGRDLPGRQTLVDLLRALPSHGGDVRYRLSSIEPATCQDALVDLVASDARFAPSFHFPLQHASDAVLTRMRRPSGLEAFRRTVDRVRTVLPDAAIGTDLLVGFPGETDRDHRLLVEYLKASPVTAVHVFPFSPRPGTEAETFGDRVPVPVVRERTAELRVIGRSLHARFRKGQHARTRRALTVGAGDRALTDNGLSVPVPPVGSRNLWVDVTLAWTGRGLVGGVVGPVPAGAR